MTSQRVKQKRFEVLREQRRIRLVLARQFSSLQPNLAMWCTEASDFAKALTNTFTNFSFAPSNNLRWP